jgi:hypothetical protein
VECGRESVGPIERWRVYLTDDEPPKPVVHCPVCAEREFDWRELEKVRCAAASTRRASSGIV